jgi:hypothetical protein
MSEVAITQRALSLEERAAMEEALNLAARLAMTPSPLRMEQVQRLYDEFLRDSVTDSDAVISLGVAYGAAIIEQSTFDWVRVTDQWGDETCVGPPHKTIHCAPIAMLRKRLARREAVDLKQLGDTVIQSMIEQLEDGQTDDW